MTLGSCMVVCYVCVGAEIDSEKYSSNRSYIQSISCSRVEDEIFSVNVCKQGKQDIGVQINTSNIKCAMWHPEYAIFLYLCSTDTVW